MTLLGIDAGTTGCKVALFSPDGEMLCSAYREYDIQRPQPGWAELDAASRLEPDQRRDLRSHRADQHRLYSSVGGVVDGRGARPRDDETADILAPSVLNFDVRGEEYLDELGRVLDNQRLYPINGNTLGNHYSLTKLKWIKQHQPELYHHAAKFLHWSGFIAFMLGADPTVDYSLANCTLLFDLDRERGPPTARTGGPRRR